MAQGVQSHVTPVREVVLLNRLLDEREATIRDLRARLDASDDERRRLTLLLSPPTPAAPDQPRPLGRRVLDWLIKQHV